jgi:hypothetical protein
METFLENMPLYQKFLIVDDGVWRLSKFASLPAITAVCPKCSDRHTFNSHLVNNQVPNSYESMGSFNQVRAADNSIFRLTYICKKCNHFKKDFFIRFVIEDYEGTDKKGVHNKVYVTKIGQYPAFSIEPEPTMIAYLDKKNLELYENGIICESQSYGVGAFAYYRQVVENKITSLLDDVEKFLENNNKESREAFKQAKTDQDTAKKIKLVSDYLPSVLKPDGINVLRMIYTALSDGLHNKSDEECLRIAQDLRACLAFLVKKIEEQKSDVKSFKESVKTLQTKVQTTRANNKQ